MRPLTAVVHLMLTRLPLVPCSTTTHGITFWVTFDALLIAPSATIATTLRARPTEEKSAICASVVEHVWPLVAAGEVRPVVHGTMPLGEVAAAHELMASGEHSGKILLTV